jgi:hypothetical protein
MSIKSDHSITPPPELVQQWIQEAHPHECTGQQIATRAAQWGADQELEACCEYLMHCAQWEPEDVDELRGARRPKPQSVKELALEELYAAERLYPADWTAIRRALEALPND